jgi:hypothetical protein
MSNLIQPLFMRIFCRVHHVLLTPMYHLHHHMQYPDILILRSWNLRCACRSRLSLSNFSRYCVLELRRGLASSPIIVFPLVNVDAALQALALYPHKHWSGPSSSWSTVIAEGTSRIYDLPRQAILGRSGAVENQCIDLFDSRTGLLSTGAESPYIQCSLTKGASLGLSAPNMWPHISAINTVICWRWRFPTGALTSLQI